MDAPAILAVDGGNSKIDAALVQASGAVRAAVRLQSSGHGGAGSQSHLDHVADAIEAVWSEANLDHNDHLLADVGVYCLAGLDFPADDERIGAWIRGQGWTRRDRLHNDTFAVLRAGTERTWGVAVVCGQGTNCAGVAPDGRTVRFPAIGDISGDWGGGSDIGMDALWHAVRAEDERGSWTALATGVPAYFGMTRPSEVTEAIHFGAVSRWRIAELSPVVFRTAGEGDPVARSIVDRQADEAVVLAGTAIKRLDMTTLDVDVVLGGGIFRNEDEAFFARLRSGLEAIAPRVRVMILRTPPVVGAALMGLDLLGPSASAARRIRAALTHERLEPSTAITTKGGRAWPRSS